MTIFSAFEPFPLVCDYSLALLIPLFPGVPELSVVKYVVKKRFVTRGGTRYRVQSGSVFAGLGYCNSAGEVMQVISEKQAYQFLEGYKQRNSYRHQLTQAMSSSDFICDYRV